MKKELLTNLCVVLALTSPVFAVENEETLTANDKTVETNETGKEKTVDASESTENKSNAETIAEGDYDCLSSFRVYNNTSQTVTIINAQDTDTVPSGSYSYTYGECGTPVKYSVDGEYKLNDGSTATCSYKAVGTKNYPSEQGAVESIGLTALCGNEEKTAEIKSFTDTQYKYSGWSNTGNPREYAYALKLKATNPDGPMEGVEFTIADKNGNIMQDIYGNDIVLLTDENGEAKVALYAGYSYFVKESNIDSKWSIINGQITTESTNATLLKASEFSDSDIVEYYSIVFENEMSNEEGEIQDKIAEEKTKIAEWKENAIIEINSLFANVDTSNFNKNDLESFAKLKQSALDVLNIDEQNYLDKLELEIRDGIEPVYKFDLTQYETTITSYGHHWKHVLVLVLALITGVLHFVFNKHMLIDLLAIGGIALYMQDRCTLSLVFLILQIVFCAFFTIMEKVYKTEGLDKDDNSEDEERDNK